MQAGKTSASGRPAHQQGDWNQLHHHQRLSLTGRCFPSRNAEEVSHKRHVASGSLNESAVIISTGYQIVHFGKVSGNLEQTKFF